MGNVNRGLIALLAATVVFFALWLIALKPGNNSSGGKAGLGQFQNDINAAKGVQSTVNKASAAAGGDTTASSTSTGSSSTPATRTTTQTTSAQSSTTHSATHHHARVIAHHRANARTVKLPSLSTPAARLAAVGSALKSHKVLAVLFYNPAAPDDHAVKQELRTISSHRGAVVKLAIPLNELPSYTQVINQVPVNFSPALVVIDRAQQASEITGFADSFEITQRIDDALLSGTTAG